jgi:anaerobic ribonucleoside-triphosphate reductase activating protein
LSINFNIAAINQCTEAEGPNKRLAIWFQGCNIQCAECCNPKLFSLKKANVISLDDLIEVIKKAHQNFEIEGVTFLGGEPTMQKGLSELSKSIQKLGLGVLLFTGIVIEELPEELVKSVDLIVDGQFEKDNIDYERNLIGSTNQRLICISDKYKNSLDWFYSIRPKKVELNVSETIFKTGDVL